MSATNGSAPAAAAIGTNGTSNGDSKPHFVAPNQPSRCTWKQLQTKNPHIDRS